MKQIPELFTAEDAKNNFNQYLNSFFDIDVHRAIMKLINEASLNGYSMIRPIGFTEKQLMGITNRLIEKGFTVGTYVDTGTFAIGWEVNSTWDKMKW